MAKKRGGRFPLLVYAPLRQRWVRLGLFLMAECILLWWLAPRLLGPTPLRHLALLPVLVGAVLVLYGLAARRMAYVQCFPSYLRIRTPVYPLVISYRRITETRTLQLKQIFDPQREKAARRAWPVRYWLMTTIAVELRGFPVSERWLRLWFDRYLFTPGTPGLVLLVEDWMDLSRQLNAFLAEYRAPRPP